MGQPIFGSLGAIYVLLFLGLDISTNTGIV